MAVRYEQRHCRLLPQLQFHARETTRQVNNISRVQPFPVTPTKMFWDDIPAAEYHMRLNKRDALINYNITASRKYSHLI